MLQTHLKIVKLCELSLTVSIALSQTQHSRKIALTQHDAQRQTVFVPKGLEFWKAFMELDALEQGAG